MDCASLTHRLAVSLAVEVEPRAVVLPKGRLRCAGTAITRTARTTQELARDTAAYRSG